MTLELEVASAELGDKRLIKRLSLILERSETHPNLSIPAAMHGRAEMEAADGFFARWNPAWFCLAKDMGARFDCHGCSCRNQEENA